MQFEQFVAPLVGLPISHVWRGYGSALFIEFGVLRPPKLRRDGSPGNPAGEMGLMIDSDWRIERRHSILCGSGASEAKRAKALNQLLGTTVTEAAFVGRLPEITISLSNGLHLASFMTDSSQPQWALFDRSNPDVSWLAVRAGRLIHEFDVDYPRPQAGARGTAMAIRHDNRGR